MGARVIEKHFTINKRMSGWDHRISSDPEELKFICDYAYRIEKILGQRKILGSNIKKICCFLDVVLLQQNLHKGKKIIFSDLDFKRPGDGLEPIKFKNLIGKILNKNINYDDQITLNDIVK